MACVAHFIIMMPHNFIQGYIRVFTRDVQPGKALFRYYAIVDFGVGGERAESREFVEN